MLFISVYSRYVPLNYILFFSSQLSGSFQLCCMSQLYQKKSFKSSRGWSIKSQIWGRCNFMPLKCRSTKTIFVPKIQINWANIDQVITLCCKKVIYHLPRTVLFKIFRNQLHFQNVLQRTTACKSFKTPRCGSSSAILFLVEKTTYVCEHEV